MITRRWLMDEWRDTFVVQAQLHQVSGRRIGEALAEIETHCADSGQSPDRAFGDPTRYAETLARDVAPAGSTTRRTPVWAAALLTFATLGGISCLLSGVEAVSHSTRGALTVGQIVTVTFGVIWVSFITAVFLRPGAPKVTQRTGVATALGLPGMLLPQLLWKQVMVQVPGWPLLLAGGLLLALAWWPRAADRMFPERVIDPRTGGEAFNRPRWLLAVIRWGLPVTLVCAVVAAAWLPASSG
ncbi:MAG TPA: hypothetical protein VK453_28950 [Micromonosporaceae bacterium]|nr:hypothetical protein [Micromonosporaceae bacterium]